MVNGRWGFDEGDTGNFGPVDTLPEKRAALRRAARRYYPQCYNADDHDLPVFPTIGAHEYGDRRPGHTKQGTWVRIPA